MIFDIDSTGGLIRVGPAAILWQNAESCPSSDGYPGFTTISWNDVSIELGDIDSGNGIHVTTFKDGDIHCQKTLLRL